MHQPAGGDVLPKASEEVGRLGVGVVHGVQEPQREGKLQRVRVVAHRFDGPETELVGAGQPMMSGDRWVVGADAMGDSRDDSGDLQGGNGGIRLGPNGAQPAVSLTGSANGSPPSRRETDISLWPA
jgi:hypothetical protein